MLAYICPRSHGRENSGIRIYSGMILKTIVGLAITIASATITLTKTLTSYNRDYLEKIKGKKYIYIYFFHKG